MLGSPASHVSPQVGQLQQTQRQAARAEGLPKHVAKKKRGFRSGGKKTETSRRYQLLQF